ncbi:MAG TPA: UvrD-helicase domain-containing protein [Smithellaceae bacterium]|jgi:ATP-dependent exoDNAse (exonuclease V) beta subunit|nr:UvrD-helicase domain-containing protein [Smithellaceae bacterium]HQF83593.1 UvrD-helicase domain-containing protein [Smithellaceae bacterium]HQG79577.1 UvrD-helicase domain-containing protein [Smithellaceae bacterium]
MESILLQASAGSGKTTRLTHEVFKRISGGAKFICALTFTRAATTQMRVRIMQEIAQNENLSLAERLGLIMEAGRVAYSTIDAFFYRLFTTTGKFAELADEKVKMRLLAQIGASWRDRVVQDGNAAGVIMAARILGTDIESLFESLVGEDSSWPFGANEPTVAELGDLMTENAMLQNRLAGLYERAARMEGEVTANVRNRVITCMSGYDNFISKVLATHADLADYLSLGKKINWQDAPYSLLNDIFCSYRENAQRLAVNKALLREVAVSSLYCSYREVARDIKDMNGVVFFQDLRDALLELDNHEQRQRPHLMELYFSLGLDRTQHLLIDEFQDTSKSDIAILMPLIEEILSGPDERGDRSFFAVGDWKQMIYGWRGADREALEEAIGAYIQNGTIRENFLPYNYRSTKRLISFFNELVENLFEGREKNEKQLPPEGSPEFDGPTEVNHQVLEKDGRSQEPFYGAMADYISKKKDHYNCSWGDMIVLTLTNNHAQKIEAALRSRGIGVSTVKGRQLLSTQEGVSVMTFLALVLEVEKPSAYLSAAASSALMNRLSIDIRGTRAEFTMKYPRPFSLMPVLAAIELLRGKISSSVLDIWREEAHSFFTEGGHDADEFLSAMFAARLHISVPETSHSEFIKVDTIHGAKGLQFRHVFVFWDEEEKSSHFYLESRNSWVRFSSNEINLLRAGRTPEAGEVVACYDRSLARARRERANLLYVAVTRARQTLTVFLPGKKSGDYPHAHQALLDTFAGFRVPASEEKSRGPAVEPAEDEVLFFDTVSVQNGEPEPYGEIDPELLSRSIQTGIVRGERLHRWLAGVGVSGDLLPKGELSDEEYQTVLRFMNKREVRELIFRPGRVYTEQQISDRENFGIVDRMIVSDELVTVIDYKSGSLRGLRQKYEEQLQRYQHILQKLYPAARVEYHILPVDG